VGWGGGSERSCKKVLRGGGRCGERIPNRFRAARLRLRDDQRGEEQRGSSPPEHLLDEGDDMSFGRMFSLAFISLSASSMPLGGWMGGWVDGWVDGWMDGWMGGGMDG